MELDPLMEEDDEDELESSIVDQYESHWNDEDEVIEQSSIVIVMVMALRASTFSASGKWLKLTMQTKIVMQRKLVLQLKMVIRLKPAAATTVMRRA